MLHTINRLLALKMHLWNPRTCQSRRKKRKIVVCLLEPTIYTYISVHLVSAQDRWKRGHLSEGFPRIWSLEQYYWEESCAAMYWSQVGSIGLQWLIGPISSQLYIQWHMLKLTTVGVFTQWEETTAANLGSFHGVCCWRFTQDTSEIMGFEELVMFS